MMHKFIIRKAVFKVRGQLISTYYYWFSGESRLQAIYSHFDFLVFSNRWRKANGYDPIKWTDKSIEKVLHEFLRNNI